MDELDTQLIAQLRHNARLSVADLAHKLKVSRGTVTNRLRKLEDGQTIVGYTVQLKPSSTHEGIRCWMGIQIEGNQTHEVIARLLGEPSVAALHDTNGRWDLLAELEVASMAELSKALERIRLLKGIRSTETSILLASYK
jgi:DNA-binding Lrp family transcriptional regulator